VGGDEEKAARALFAQPAEKVASQLGGAVGKLVLEFGAFQLANKRTKRRAVNEGYFQLDDVVAYLKNSLLYLQQGDDAIELLIGALTDLLMNKFIEKIERSADADVESLVPDASTSELTLPDFYPQRKRRLGSTIVLTFPPSFSL
jgi:hypothetical protein